MCMNRKSYWIKLVVFGFGFITVCAQAATLELTKGRDARIPVAVVKFSGQPVISKIISQDLKNVGKFAVDYKYSGKLPHTVDAVDIGYFRDEGADDLIVGSAKHQQNGKYLVSYALLDLFNQGNGSGMDPVLISKQYEVSKAQLRRVAHAISDDVYYELTGKRGAFSTRLAYVVEQQGKNSPRYLLNVSDYDGGDAHTLVNSAVPLMSPRWSPNGRELAYVSFGNKGSEVYLINIITGRRTLLLDFPGLNAAPAWAPSGKQMAVVLSKGDAQNIYLLTLATQKLYQVTHGNVIDTEPRFSPDGSTLAFSSNRQGSPEIYFLNLQTGKIKLVTTEGRYNATPDFMPNSKGLVIIHKVDQLYAVALLNLQNNQLKVLTRPALLQSPSVAPNGSMIAYAEQTTGNGRIGLVASNGKAQTYLPAVNGDMQEPAWSPFLK